MNGWTDQTIPDQTGVRFLITGANSGLGLETARALARKGAHVVMACRNPAKAEEAATSVRRDAKGEITTIALDLASLSSVSACTAELTQRGHGLDVLVNNAGLMAIPEGKTEDGFEMTFGVNHLGHFALTARLWPLLCKSARARVVTVSSLVEIWGRLSVDDPFGERRGSYDRWRVYGDSKLANALFVKELARRTARAGVAVKSCGAHPGYAATELQAKGSTMGGSRLEGSFMGLGNRLFAQTQAQGAWPELRAATDPDAENGSFFGPNGLGEVRGPARKTEPKSSRSRDASLGAALWDESQKRTGMVFEGL